MDFLVLWLFGLLSIFSAFGPAEYEEAPPEPSVSAEPSPVASPVIDPIAEQFIQRTPLPSCGEYQVEHGYYEESAQPGWQCLAEAQDGKGAEVTFVTVPTGQMASSYSYVRVNDGVMEIYVNDSTDQLRPWTYESCPTEDSSFRQGCP